VQHQAIIDKLKRGESIGPVHDLDSKEVQEVVGNCRTLIKRNSNRGRQVTIIATGILIQKE
jgi:hypothetical protein